MGWSSGSTVGSAVEAALTPYLDRFTAEELLGIGRIVASTLEDLDADDLEECDGFVGDAANRSRYEKPGRPAPQVGDTVKFYGDILTFDGKRWCYPKDE